jgi:dTDP-4-dehydrorhamnose reductase
MLRLAAERDELKVIDDQVGAPTGAELIADVTALCLRSVLREAGPVSEREHGNAGQAAGARSGVYHLVASGETSWHGYARFMIDMARAAGLPLRVAHDAIRAVSSSEFPTPAKRPLNSRLSTARLQEDFGLVLPDWKVGATRLFDELNAARPPVAQPAAASTPAQPVAASPAAPIPTPAERKASL